MEIEEEDSVDLFKIQPKTEKNPGFIVRITENGVVELFEYTETDNTLDLLNVVYNLIDGKTGGMLFNIQRSTKKSLFHAFGSLDFQDTDKVNNYRVQNLLSHLKFHLPYGIKGPVVIISDKDRGMPREHANDIKRMMAELPVQEPEPNKTNIKMEPKASKPTKTTKKKESTKKKDIEPVLLKKPRLRKNSSLLDPK